MSIIFMDSFDHYTTQAQLQTKGWLPAATGQPSSTYKRTGGYALALAGNNSCAALSTAVPNGTAMYVHYAVYIDGPQASRLCGPCGGAYVDSNSYQVMVNVSVTGVISVFNWVGGGTTIGSTAAGVFRFNTWNHLQFKFVVSDTVGEVEVYLNGALVLDLSGQDTLTQTGNPATTVGVLFSGAWTHYIDDLVINYNDVDGVNDGYLGDVRVVCLLPQTDAVAAGSNASFTCSSSTDHGALVDEATPNDDTDYLYSSTPAHVDSWEFPALGYTGVIKGVQLSLRAKKSDSGTRAIAAVTRPVSTNRVHGTVHYLGMTDYVYWKAIWDQNPEDTAAWEVADVDGAEFGVTVSV